MTEPTEAEQEALLLGYKEPYPEGLKRWVRGLVVPYEAGGWGPWLEFGWHEKFYRKVYKTQQREVLRHLYALKARKQGMSMMMVVDTLHRLMWFPGLNDLYVTYHEDAAYKKAESFQARLQGVYNTLPEWQRKLCPLWDMKEDRAQVAGFGTEGQVAVAQYWADRSSPELRGMPMPTSVVKIATASPNVGRAEDLTRVVLDEVEAYEQPEATWSAVEPSVRRSGGIIVALGTLTDRSHPGSLLWRRLEQVRRGERGGEWMFLGYGGRPDDSEESWRQAHEDAEATGDLVMFYRSYGRTLEEVMTGTGTGLATAQELEASHGGALALSLPPSLAEYGGV